MFCEIRYQSFNGEMIFDPTLHSTLKETNKFVSNFTHLWEHKFDRSLETLGDCDHHVCAEHPEDVIEEESAQEDAAGHHVVEVEELHSVDGEGHAEEVVGQPMLLHDVPDPDRGAQAQAHQVMCAELIIQHRLLIVSFTLQSKFVFCFLLAALSSVAKYFTCVNLRWNGMIGTALGISLRMTGDIMWLRAKMPSTRK